MLLPSSAIAVALRSLTRISRLRRASWALTSSSTSESSVAAMSAPCGQGTKISRRPPRLEKRKPEMKPRSVSEIVVTRLPAGGWAATEAWGGATIAAARCSFCACAGTPVSAPQSAAATSAVADCLMVMMLLLGRRAGFGAGRGTQPDDALGHARHFVGGERAPGFQRRQHDLLDRAGSLAGCDKAHGRADAAEIVGAAMCVR